MSSLPPEPGEVSDPTLGVQGDFGEPPVEENSPADVEINDDEDYEE